jgi:hypothetical protein
LVRTVDGIRLNTAARSKNRILDSYEIIGMLIGFIGSSKEAAGSEKQPRIT